MNICKALFYPALLMSFHCFAQSGKQIKVTPPAPFGPVPTERQLAWQEMEMYNMIEFGPIQYLEEKDWGWGNESPEIVNPAKFNAEEIVLRAKKAGFKGFLVQAKHHGGFCMWPSETTPYNISKSPWRNGKGDWIREWQSACAKHDMKFGVYCSPWDRNAAIFGSAEYLNMYKEQLTELMTEYGELFTMWFDGAPGEGGDGYYGGANEYRGGFLNYYNWDSIYALVRRLQPNAVIFSDPGPDIRWVGNEKGRGGETCWETYIKPGKKWDGRPSPHNNPADLNKGVRNGMHWIPAECDVSLRRRFTYHASDNNTVKTPLELFDIYVNSVGRGGCLDLNLPINREGEQDEADKKALTGFGEYLQQTFQTNLATGAKIIASNVRGNDKAQFGTNHLLDDDRYSYWATDDGIHNPEITVELPQKKKFNIIKLRENIKLGQRIDSVEVSILKDGSWQSIAKATSIGACRIIRLKHYLQTGKIRVKLYAPVCIALSELSLYAEPEKNEAPVINRSKEGFISLSTSRPVSGIRYTLDGSDPTTASKVYVNPFRSNDQVEIRAAAFDANGARGEIAIADLDMPKKDWTIIDQSAEGGSNQLANAIDDNEKTIWEAKDGLPQWIAIDMGKEETVAAFTYTPRQDGVVSGVVDKYEYYVSNDKTSWEKVADGDFPNMRNSPVKRIVPLKKQVSCRYFKFTATHTLDNSKVTLAEIGIRNR